MAESIYKNLEQLLRDYDWKKNPQKNTGTTIRNGSFRLNEYSCNVGFTKHFRYKGHPIREGQLYKKNKGLIYKECKRLFGFFDFDGCMINKNFKCPPHFDKNNKSDILIVGVGEYAEGELVISDVPVDIHYKPYTFNGGLHEHYVKEWSGGDRYTITMFKIKPT